MGANPSISAALNADVPKATAKEAEVKIEQSKEVQALLDGGATPVEAAALAAGTDANIMKRDKEVNEAKSCAQAWDGTPPAALTDTNAKDITTRFHDNEPRLISLLKDDDSARAAIIAACKA